ncbi:MAG TPA: hypothetical protein VHB73_05530, partial [Alphaproteobacteria bacterium]|nr:hypothetical protein [Alphaproteobacteria bacterium]
MKIRIGAGLGLLFTFVLASLPAAAETASPAISSGDTAWMLTSTALVLMMTVPGLALFYGGLVRKQNMLATAMQTFATCSLAAVVWAVAGYSLAFTNGSVAGPDHSTWIGDFSRLLFSGVDHASAFIL